MPITRATLRTPLPLTPLLPLTPFLRNAYCLCNFTTPPVTPPPRPAPTFFKKCLLSVPLYVPPIPPFPFKKYLLPVSLYIPPLRIPTANPLAEISCQLSMLL
jgi:hypothetical protein